MLTETDRELLATLRTLDQKRTQGEWEVTFPSHSFNDFAVWEENARGNGDKRVACWIRTVETADFIAACGTHMPRLMEIIARLESDDSMLDGIITECFTALSDAGITPSAEREPKADYAADLVGQLTDAFRKRAADSARLAEIEAVWRGAGA